MADNNTIARPYAQAAFEVATEAGKLADWSSALAAAKELLADGQVAVFLANPALASEQRLEFLTSLMKSIDGSSLLSGDSKEGTNFLKLLLEYGRVPVLPEISDLFDELKSRVENTVDVTVTSAAPLSDKDRDEFANALQLRLGRDVRIETEIDKSLIGGAIVTAGDVVIDGSLRSRLDSLANALTA